MKAKTPAANGRGAGMLGGFRTPISPEPYCSQPLILPPLIALHLGGEAVAALAFAIGSASNG